MEPCLASFAMTEELADVNIWNNQAQLLWKPEVLFHSRVSLVVLEGLACSLIMSSFYLAYNAPRYQLV
ncbi:hypothetical protein BDV38DRAFT_249800 [Aspergillus pseudotamarii]|uniref:Uncharacterized protein n=1 Tax=Aspergillus pseudotamarii TaxID=132259 RepID=A0A5N6SNP0_ASPPS|nr:uncharacterized protein BDV38DRAFT_249800 [Aspergillus pseudotamarii]KAE8136296.1 hypothetical protein BDV38DRAFT_249800 [Aspergillus pseudotamarii]